MAYSVIVEKMVEVSERQLEQCVEKYLNDGYKVDNSIIEMVDVEEEYLGGRKETKKRINAVYVFTKFTDEKKKKKEIAKVENKEYPKHVNEAIRAFNKNGVKYKICNAEIGHFKVWCYGKEKEVQYWSSNGRIEKSSERGLDIILKLGTLPF